MYQDRCSPCTYHLSVRPPRPCLLFRCHQMYSRGRAGPREVLQRISESVLMLNPGKGVLQVHLPALLYEQASFSRLHRITLSWFGRCFLSMAG